MKKTLWCGLVLATVLSSCMKDKNLYDEDRVSSKKQEEYKNWALLVFALLLVEILLRNTLLRNIP